MDCFDILGISSNSDKKAIKHAYAKKKKKYNPEQFEIIGLGSGDSAKKIGIERNYRGRTDLAYTDGDGKHHCPFGRIIIKNKKVYKDED